MSIMEDGAELPILWAAPFSKFLLSVGEGESLQYPESREDVDCCWGASDGLWGLFSPVAVQQLSLENLTAECGWWPQPSGLWPFTENYCWAVEIMIENK